MREECGGFNIAGLLADAEKINTRCPNWIGSAGGVAALPRTAHAAILLNGMRHVKRFSRSLK
jgi:hypothetical protein